MLSAGIFVGAMVVNHVARSISTAPHPVGVAWCPIKIKLRTTFRGGRDLTAGWCLKLSCHRWLLQLRASLVVVGKDVTGDGDRNAAGRVGLYRRSVILTGDVSPLPLVWCPTNFRLHGRSLVLAGDHGLHLIQ